MKNIYFLLLFVLIAAVSVSCEDSDGKVKRFLTVDPTETEITFNDAEQTKSIEIRTDETNKLAVEWIGDDWGRVEPTSTGITIHVNANMVNTPRTATIIVALAQGKDQVEIKVTQTKQQPLLGSVPNELLFSQLAGQKEIMVTTNQSDWQVEVPTADWVTVETDRIKGRLLVDVEENTEDAERSIDIVLSSAAAGVSKTVKVIQMAIQTYMLPYLEFGKPLPDMYTFEEARGSTYFGGSRIAAIIMGTTSEIMPHINYSVEQDHQYYLMQMDAYYVKTLFDESKYRAMTTAIGYEYIFDEATPWGPAKVSWKEANKSVSINVDLNYGEEGYVIFQQMDQKPGNPIQDAPMPTFTSFPEGFTTMGASLPDIRAWEVQKGTTEMADMSGGKFDAIGFLTKSSPLVARMYYLHGWTIEEGLTRYIYIFDDVSLALIRASLSNVLTHEFSAFLSNLGWANLYPAIPSREHVFRHAGEGLEMRIYIAKFLDLEGYEGKDVLCLSVTEYDTTAPMTSTSEYKTPSDALQRHGKGVYLRDLVK